MWNFKIIETGMPHIINTTKVCVTFDAVHLLFKFGMTTRLVQKSINFDDEFVLLSIVKESLDNAVLILPPLRINSSATMPTVNNLDRLVQKITKKSAMQITHPLTRKRPQLAVTEMKVTPK